MLWIVAAPGPSLTPEVAEACRPYPTIAVNDAYQICPFAQHLYAADSLWWDMRKGAPDFQGMRWTCRVKHYDNEKQIKQYGLACVAGANGEGFDFRPGRIHLGRNGGFQAVNLAIRFGGDFIIMVGFDMSGTHFFGEHKKPLRQKTYFRGWIDKFQEASRLLPDGMRIINATPASAMKCFPIMTIQEALNASREPRSQNFDTASDRCA